MTKDELKAILVRRLVPRLRAELAWAGVTAAVAAMGAADKANLLGAIRDGNAKLVGMLINSAVAAKLEVDANTEATAMLADDTLTLAELERAL